MRVRGEYLRPGVVHRVAAVGLLASVAAGCSSDTLRFVDNPFSSPFASASADPAPTGSLAASPTASVQAQPLAPPSAVVSRPIDAPVYNAPAAAAAARAAPVTGSVAGWSAQGGTPVTVAAGDTLTAISSRYGVPSSAILAANGLSSPAQIAPGRQIVIPVYNAAGGQVASMAPVAVPAVQQRAVQAQQAVKVETQKATAATAGKVDAKVATATSAAAAKVGKVEAKAADAQQKAAAAVKPVEPQAAPKPVAEKTAAEKPQKVAALSPVEPQQTAVAAPKEEPAAAQASSGTEFRWPVRGRVISGFTKGGNEGINIAVPEGTPVKAAEGGTVAYAGSELKGYGNLVLIRHDDGWVSAYAHNGELSVKRGEKVKRGQTIAKSGQSGNVSSPQLHFELRKGSTPVDPVPHLAGT